MQQLFKFQTIALHCIALHCNGSSRLDLRDHPEADLGGDEGGAQGAQAGVSEYGGVVEQVERSPLSLPVPAKFIPGHGDSHVICY